MTLRDATYGEEPLSMAIGIDDAVRISVRVVDEIKFGLVDFDATIELIRARQFRKRLFIETATLLGEQLAERMEDAEGWHDASRIGPARKQLGGKW
jgi:hypothetical protein